MARNFLLDARKPVPLRCRDLHGGTSKLNERIRQFFDGIPKTIHRLWNVTCRSPKLTCHQGCHLVYLARIETRRTDKPKSSVLWTNPQDKAVILTLAARSKGWHTCARTLGVDFNVNMRISGESSGVS